MYELIQAAPRTYYIQCPAKMGLWRLTDTDVVLIDSGNDKDAGRKVQKILDAQGWHLACILNTHANADHNGGNALLVRHEAGVSLVASGRPSSDFLEKLCLRENIDRFAEVIFLAPAYEVNAALPILLQYAEADVLYVAEEAEFSPSLFRTVEVRAEDGFFAFGGGEAAFLNEETLFWNFGGARVLLSMGELPARLPQCDLLIAEEENEAFSACSPALEAYFGPAEGKPSVYLSGSLQIGRKDGIITIEGGS